VADAWLYALFLYRKRAPHAHGRITQIRHAQRITELVLAPRLSICCAGWAICFLWGHQQHAAIPHELHPFSLSQIQDNMTIRISAKAIGDYTRLLPTLQIDDRVVVYGPHGMFGRQGTVGGTQIWVAGIGITPFLSLLQAEIRQPRASRVDVIWAVRQYEEAIYAQEMCDSVVHAPHISIHIHQGVLTRNNDCSDHRTCNYTHYDHFLCGPVPMMHGLRAQWRDCGVAPHQIISEEFGMR
jgi:predicted ferric reductase